MNIIVAGGGWAGCAAALAAKKQGANVCLLERTDMLLGTGLVGGIMRNNGRFTATEEMIAMGGGDLFKVIDANVIHKNIDFPGHRHASLYNVATMEPKIRRFLLENGIEIHMISRVVDVEMERDLIRAVVVKRGKTEERMPADAVVETTGTAGPMKNCTAYGNGCAMCALRCHTFGGRVSLAAKAGIDEMNGIKGEQVGALSGSCKLHKESLSMEIQEALNTTGVAVVALPAELRMKGKLALKACQQYAIQEFEQNVVLLDTSHAKLMSPFFPLDVLRKVKGLENARYEDPYSGGVGNSVRFIGMSPREDSLRVSGLSNLFCGGEKAGLLVGHTEAICTGTLAGFNAARFLLGKPLLVLPDCLAVGDAIAHVREQMAQGELARKITFSGAGFFERMKEKELYTTDISAIEARVEKAGVAGVFA